MGHIANMRQREVAQCVLVIYAYLPALGVCIA